jgi:hypothetical protein
VYVAVDANRRKTRIPESVKENLPAPNSD